MDSHFEPKNIEGPLYAAWQKNGYFTPQSTDNPYCIMQPPPNVTGYLHMGHGFQLTLMDALIRYKQMSGHNTLWQAGLDHAGIATQMVVERHLESQGKTREALGREAFTDAIWDWKSQSGDMIENQIKRMGCALDWDNQVFTLDPKVNDAVNHTFEKLYDEGLIYRAHKLVNWDTSLQTAVSDLEVESVSKQGHLWHIQYPVVDAEMTITIATTRPETLFGDTAVAVNPEDPRYKDYLGKTLRIPVSGREIPIIADDYVDPDFGTGAVKITPGHDFNDHELGKRHDLPLINIMHPDGTLNENVPEAYQNMAYLAARKALLDALQAQGHLVHTEPYTHQVPICERSGAVIQPMLTRQWFMAMSSLAEPAIAAVKSGEITITPANWEKTYFQWLENIQDWCLSRQLWWGHRIPAWYDAEQQCYVGKDEASVRAKYGLAPDHTLTQDEDVLDTWFSSSLWPFVTLGWPENTERLQSFYPTDVLVTGFDIIFFWVARMVMMGLKLTDQVPFKSIYITGLIRDSHGQKMSKSKGNVLDPQDLIQGISLEDLLEKRCTTMMQPQLRDKIAKQTAEAFPDGIPAHGTDALRFTFCALASTGRDINFELGRLGGYKNFCNKIWNAARYVLMQTEDYQHRDLPPSQNLFDQWLMHQRNVLLKKVDSHFKQYRFDLLASELYEFTWQVFCDWGLEFSKVTLNQASSDERQSCQHTLLLVLADILKALHPFMPFITDAIWPQIADKLGLKTLHILDEAYPTPTDNDYSPAYQSICQLQALVSGVRSMRSDAQISPQKTVESLIIYCEPGEDMGWLQTFEPWIISLCKCRTITLVTSALNEHHEDHITSHVGNLTLSLPLAGLVDKGEELKKMHTSLKKIDKSLLQSESKLSNPDFTAHAPADVVAKEKDKVADLSRQKEQLLQRQQLLSSAD